MKYYGEGSVKPGMHFILTFKIRVRFILITMVTDMSVCRPELPGALPKITLLLRRYDDDHAVHQRRFF